MRRLIHLVGLLCFMLLFTSITKAQDQTDQQWKNYDLKYRTFRVTLVPGLSTNGLDAIDYAGKYSWNILGGYHGALENGFELGGLVNAHKYYAHGVQIAGLGNYTGENMAGVQLAGLTNISRSDMQGIQIAGVGNWANAELQGLQLSGVFNISGGNSQGLQFAGVSNISKNDVQGLIASGVGNIAGGNMQGLVFGGAFNIARNDMQGIVASALLNYSASFQGISLAAVNFNKDMQGIQSGVINTAQNAQGIQIGLINYAQEFEGVPVGLISYYDNGRTNIDTWTSDGGFTNMGVKLGTEEVYNMISIGYNPFSGRDVWQLGWSIGRKYDHDSYFHYSDFSYYKINEGGWTTDLNSIFKYRLLFGKAFSSGFKLYGGPTINMMISKVEDSKDYYWYRIHSFGAKGREYSFWGGLAIGLELL